MITYYAYNCKHREVRELENPTKQEWLILETLWENSPLFLSEIVDALQGELPWKRATYQTYLRRMCAKSLISYNEVRGSYAYYPLVQREQCVQNESRQMISKFRGDSTRLFLANMISEGGLGKQDTQQLKRLIDELSAGFTEDGD